MSTPAALRGNIPRVFWMRAGYMFLVVMPVIVPYYRHHDLSMHQVYLLQTVFALAVAALEVPSGYAADLLGRRRTLILASALGGAAFTVLALSRGFAGFVIFEVVAAFGASLYSGTDVALLYDTREALGDESSGTADLGRQLQWGQVGETIAALLGGALVLIHLRLPVIANAVTAWIPLFIAWGLVEPPRQMMDAGRHRENIRMIGAALFGHSRLLSLVLLSLIGYGVATLVAVWAFQGYWGEQGIPIGWFGVLWAAYNLTVAGVGRVAGRVEERLGGAGSVLLIGVLPIVGYLGMAWGGAILGVVAGFAFQVSRGLTQVILRHALNARVTAGFRATANSVSSLGVRLSFAVLGPLMGFVIDGRGYPVALTLFGAIYVVLLGVLVVPLAREVRREIEGGPTGDVARE